MDIITAMTVGDLAIAVVDIAIVAFVVYKLFTLIRGTRAVQLLKGIVLLLLLTQVSGLLHLVTVHWILSNLQVGLVIALPIVFQPELRRALEQLGRGRLFGGSRSWLGGEDADRVVEAVVRAAEMLRRNRFGALIVMERTTGLNDVIETGVKIEGKCRRNCSPTYSSRTHPCMTAPSSSGPEKSWLRLVSYPSRKPFMCVPP